MTSRPAWYDGVAPVELDVPGALGGGSHRLVWRQGSLVAEHHPDADAERALEALGGGRCPCLDLLDAWDAHARDPAVLAVGTRGPDDRVRLDRVELQGLLEGPVADWRRQVATALTYVTTTAPRTAVDREEAATEGPVAAAEAALRRRIEFLRLFTMPPDIQHRLAVTVAAHAEEVWADPSFRRAHGPRVEAALVARATTAVRAAARASAGAAADAGVDVGGDRGGGGDVEVAVELMAAGRPASLIARAATRRRCGAVTVRLPVSWLAAVWGRGVATVGASFVLDVVAVDRQHLEVLAVDFRAVDFGSVDFGSVDFGAVDSSATGWRRLTATSRKVAVEQGVGR